MMLRFQRESNGTEAHLTLGEEFEVALPENPTTGFRWQGPDDDDGVRLVREDFELSGSATGAGGMHTWQFQAVQEGQIMLRFQHKRSWESRSADSFEITVRVALAK